MGCLTSSLDFLQIKRGTPYYADIICENKALPHLPNELWIMIDDVLTLLIIEDHARRFMFRFERIQPFKQIFTLPLFDFEDYYPKYTCRVYPGKRVIHYHDAKVTIIYSNIESYAYECRMRLKEAMLNDVKVVEDF